jgi:G3E family GTPase
VRAVTDADRRLPVCVLSGFLGSGKTTLLRRMFAAPRMAGTAVLINEFGEIGLDHLLVRPVHGNAVVLQNGCICCTLQSDLQQGLRDLIDSRSDPALPPFERIVVETTGLADPAPVLQTLVLDPMLRHQIRLANTIVTIDALHGAAQLDRHVEAYRQAATADRLVITKADMADAGAVAALRVRLAALNPTARIIDAHAAGFDPCRLILEGLADPATKLAEIRHWLHQPGTSPHDHGAHGARIQSFSLRVEEQIDWTAFGVWLTALLHRHGKSVLRVKGLLNVPDARGPIVLHGVQHVIHAPVHLDAWPDADMASRLVFVVQDIDPDLVRRSLFTFLAAARPGPLRRVAAAE